MDDICSSPKCNRKKNPPSSYNKKRWMCAGSFLSAAIHRSGKIIICISEHHCFALPSVFRVQEYIRKRILSIIPAAWDRFFFVLLPEDIRSDSFHCFPVSSAFETGSNPESAGWFVSVLTICHPVLFLSAFFGIGRKPRSRYTLHASHVVVCVGMTARV